MSARSMRFVSLFVFAALALAAAVGPGSAAQDRAGSSAATGWRHAYYLFLSDTPVGCEACYVPLLITVAPIEETAKDSAGAGQDCVLITTYERDSIFQVNGMVNIARGDVDAGPRSVRVRRRNYRYQEISGAEVLRLLEHPLGTLPVSRPILHSDLPPAPGLQMLIAAFRALQ